MIIYTKFEKFFVIWKRTRKAKCGCDFAHDKTLLGTYREQFNKLPGCLETLPPKISQTVREEISFLKWSGAYPGMSQRGMATDVEKLLRDLRGGCWEYGGCKLPRTRNWLVFHYIIVFFKLLRPSGGQPYFPTNSRFFFWKIRPKWG